MTQKPEKPSPDFPLFPHGSGKWAKKIGGMLRYFGRWDDPQAALDAYQQFLAAREKPIERPAARGAMTLEDACNRFLSAKKQAAERNEISDITYMEYLRTCKRFADHIGRNCDIESLTPARFAGYKSEMAKKWNVVGVGNEVTRVRSLFRWLHESGLMRDRTHFGPDFKKASAKALRRHRRLAGKKLLNAKQIGRLLDYAGVQMQAMILLGINAG